MFGVILWWIDRTVGTRNQHLYLLITSFIPICVLNWDHMRKVYDQFINWWFANSADHSVNWYLWNTTFISSLIFFHALEA
jgi:hypothetical protein